MELMTRFIFPTLVLAAMSAGCGNNQEAPTADPTDSVEAALDAVGGADAAAPRGTPKHGFLARIKAALGTVSLTADQKSQLETVESTLHTQFAPVRAARVALRSAIADQVATGNLNPTALATPLANLAQAAASTKPAVQAAANALYATLTPTQREQLVAAMKQQREAFDRQGHLHAHHARLKKLAAELNLTSDELASIRAAMKAQWAGHTKGELGQQFSGRRQRMQTLALAFTGPAFDAAALDVGSGLATRAEQGPEHKVKMLSVMLPILTADQRQQLAQILRSETPFLADD